MVGGREVQAGRNVYVHAADSLLRAAETNTAFCKATVHQYILFKCLFYILPVFVCLVSQGPTVTQRSSFFHEP